MSGFTFNAPKSILCAPGCLSQVGGITRNLISGPVLIVTDKPLVELGLVDGLTNSLSAAGVGYELFVDVVADPPEQIVLDGLAQSKRMGAAGVIGFGGGSSMDVAKLVALMTKSGETLEQIYGVGMVKGERLPLIQIPTTAGTGSEVTPISIITTGGIEKRGVVAPQLLPDVAVLDAELTLGLPDHITAATGVDAMVHAIEAYTSASPNNNPISRALACEALRLLGANIREAVHNGSNVQARQEMLLGAMLAGQAFANSPVAAVHALAYPIGGMFHIPHGLSNALILTHVMRFNAPECSHAYAELAPYAFPELEELGEQARVPAFLTALEELVADLGLPKGLGAVNIPRDALPKMASEAMKQTRLLVNNPREFDEAAVLTLYEKAY